jgi:hypothetical protein
MGKMLGKATRNRRQGGIWWYCCEGHDGEWKHFISKKRGAQRAHENRQWRREAATELAGERQG